MVGDREGFEAHCEKWGSDSGASHSSITSNCELITDTRPANDTIRVGGGHFLEVDATIPCLHCFTVQTGIYENNS